MGTHNGSASELSEDIQRDIFADRSPPVNYCGELLKAESEIYGVLRGIRDDFKSAVLLFRAMQGMDKRLMAAVRFSLPKELNLVDARSGVPNAASTDEGFATALAAAGEGSETRRMGAYVAIAESLTESVASLKRKEAKLTERMKLQVCNSPEWRNAQERRAKVRDSISVLTRRRQHVAGLFFEVRKCVARDALAATKALLRLFRDAEGGVDAGYIEEMLARNTETVFAEIAEVGEKARRLGDERNYSKRKGWKS